MRLLASVATSNESKGVAVCGCLSRPWRVIINAHCSMTELTNK